MVAEHKPLDYDINKKKKLKKSKEKVTRLSANEKQLIIKSGIKTD